MLKLPRPVASSINKYLEVVLFLCCLSVPLQGQQPKTPEKQLFSAINNGDLVAVEHILQVGVDLDARSTNGVTPLMAAAKNGEVALVSLLLEHGAKAEAKDDQGETALTCAARGGWINVVDLLAQLSNTGEKNRALFAAVEGGPVVVKIEDPSIQPVQAHNQTAKVQESWTATVESLLNNGADIEARNENGDTPLILASTYAQTEIVELLIRRGARLVTDNEGNTPLIAAACECALATMNSAYDLVKILLEHGSPVNARSKNGTTALMNAASSFGDAAIVQLLLDNGADPRPKDRQGDTALSLARKSHREDKVRLIKDALARYN